MRTEFSFKNFKIDERLEGFIDDKIKSLRKYLKHFEEGVLHLHGNVEKNPHKDEFYSSFNLYLPKMVLHCRAVADRAETSINKAFAELAKQLDKHKTKFMNRFRTAKFPSR